jgi:phage terminase Nu1 subunit (DNA packaging protein)
MRVAPERWGWLELGFSKGVNICMATILEVCSWCGISRTTFHDAVRRGVIARKPRGEHDVREVARALIKDGQAAKGGHGDLASKLKLSEARAALAREQTAALKLKNAVARRDYVSLAGVRRDVETMFAMLRERLLAIPAKIATSCDMRECGDVEEIIRDEVDEVLEELSRPILCVDDVPSTGGSDAAGRR